MTIDMSFVLVILNFVFLLIVLNSLLYKPLKGYFTDRQTQIKNDLEEASKSVEQAKLLVIEKEDELKKAFVEARNIKDNIVKEAEQHAEKIILTARKTEADILADREYKLKELEKKTKEELENELSDIIVDLASKILAERIDGAKDKEMINSLLAKRGS